ncbi:hypothetical protein BH371_17215 [Bordetella pertussis]|nr:hypothetical protein ADU61_02290 [Bordetella pertussis]KCV23633.1 hypothetical protein AZ28_0127 [Bordetella pertussis B200]AOY25386.1 hypothetical protein BH371_17215 [Bordetella pertussis]AUR75440.1 hypothetical protein AV743_18385 [Bordetella pertussis]QKC08644.1 hypothetical protein FG003_18410 [Bordetella pertussis]
MNWGIGDFQFLKSGSDEPCIQPIESSHLERAIALGGQFIRPLDYQRRGWLRRCVDVAAYTMLRIGVALTGRAGRY